MIKERQSTSKGERREQEILLAAADMFCHKGFHATSLEDIAQAVGIRKSSLYYYAQTKDELLFRVVEMGLRPMIDELQAVCSSAHPPAEKLRRAIDVHVLNIDSQRSTMGVILREDRSVAPQHRESYIALRDAYEVLLRGLIREGVASGAFRACDPVTITRAILGMCSWLTVWYRPGGGLSAAELSSQFSELILKGLEM